MEIKIVDNCFSHVSYSSLQDSKLFKWLRTNETKDVCVFTDSMIFSAVNYPDKIKIAWLIEPMAIQKNTYDFIERNHHLFDYVFTFDENLLKLGPKFIFYPFGGCWITTENQILHNKSKLLSIIASGKKQTNGHVLRHDVINRLSSRGVFIDVFGFGYKPVENKIESLKDYRFSIVIENSKKDFYFTEKIIDCFRTGVVPIYWGCPSINNFFNIEGILTFDNLEELDEIIGSLNDKKYDTMYDAITDNYLRSENYVLADDWIYKKIKQITNESN